ncbi:Glycoside hydrolase [Croceitalea dokdonensis DOKDO 023]|uniref:Glycoside hydrolase n=1 Tax=Croceitalea dokdonensis DOKDO 023 TaxID=1300341 RepID=A0A0P7AXC7_9FLAO|nr:glycoside hydrolase [Croceitalea dokdonensis]KPM32702.1 Glycoside hydrolase [Croceitalea dokdonensis DOKDO 023]
MKVWGLLFLCLLQFSCSSQVTEKINGVSFVASREKVQQEHIDPVVAVNANYAAVMPFGFIRSLSAPSVVFNTERQWFGETRTGAKQYAQKLQQNGIKVMVKPQIWVWRGEFTGKIAMENEADWQTLEKTYLDFILTYAEMAEEVKASLFCIGTELEQFVKQRPQFWDDLITKVKERYSGKLTYAANWDEYTRTPFWEQLDYIGVDAYFPLSESKNPSKVEMSAAWQKWKVQLQDIANHTNKPILFTEFGYRSMDFTAKKPWLVDRNQMEVNLKAQAEATQVIFDEFWKEAWFAGGFVWKWFIHHKRSGGAGDNRFTPQNKPAETVIKKFYGDYK